MIVVAARTGVGRSDTGFGVVEVLRSTRKGLKRVVPSLPLRGVVRFDGAIIWSAEWERRGKVLFAKRGKGGKSSPESETDGAGVGGRALVGVCDAKIVLAVNSSE